MDDQTRHNRSSHRMSPLRWPVLALALYLVTAPLLPPGEPYHWLRTRVDAVRTALAPVHGNPNGVRTLTTPTLSGATHGAIQVYFTRPQSPSAHIDTRSGLDRTVAADLAQADRAIDIAAFDLDLPSVAEPLQRAHRRGVRVRIVVDGENLSSPVAASVLGGLEDAGIMVVYDRRPAFMHHKFIVIDKRIVWTGSWNLTTNDTYRNDNAMLRIADERIAATYGQAFIALVEGRRSPVSPTTITTDDGTTIRTMFTPDDAITPTIVAAIDNAQTSVHVLMYTFTSAPIADALIAAHRRGVRVGGVLERRSAVQQVSQFGALREAGIAVLADGNCGLLHQKTVVIDGETVITGSFNWTAAAQDDNDEHIVIVRSRWLAHAFLTEWDRAWARAQQPMRCG